MPDQQPNNEIDPERTRITPPSSGDAGRDGMSGGSSADEATRASDGAFRPIDPDQLAETPLIDGYKIHEKIHHGGQGIVFRATQLGTKRVVALKILLEGQYASQNARQRFEREVELAASLTHANIVTILDSGISHGRCYYAMDYIDGWRLNEYFKEKAPTITESLDLIETICGAVNFAHQRGVIHRDLKPSNILVDAEGRPHVLDFGLAKARGESDPRASTLPALSMTGQILGTLAYMSPEQASGTNEVDVRSDVYSLGVISYEILLGDTPYPVDGALGDVLSRITKDDPKPPRAMRSSSRFGRLIDDELETILLKALEKDLSRRYQTSGDLGRDIRRYLDGEPIEAKRASGMYMLKKTLKRYRLQAASAGVLLAMLVTFLIIFAVQYRQERDLRAQAEHLRAVAADKAQRAVLAEAREREARRQAEHDKQLAVTAAEQRRLALLRQTIQRGDLALLRGEAAEARDSYWDAYLDAPDSAAALWALRQYYMQTDDAGASYLQVRDYGPSALARGGRLAAVCDAPHSITLREVDSGRILAWFAAPGEVLALSVTESGTIAAVGADWARMWQSPALEPAVVVEFPREIVPLTVHPILDNQGLLIVEETYVWTFRGADGVLTGERSLSGDPTGAPEFSPAGDLAALTTTAGIELLTITQDGALSVKRIWTTANSGRPRAVRFQDENTLAILSDEVFIKQLSDEKSFMWRLRLDLADDWEYFDIQNGGGALVFGKPDGQAALYRDGGLVKQWQITHAKLNDLRLSPDGETLITLDNRGALTRWKTTGAAHQHIRVAETPAAKWAVSRDGAAVLFADDSGELSVYKMGRDVRPLTLQWSGLFRRLAGGSPDDLLFALNGDGSLAVIVAENRMWLADTDSLSTTPLPWRNIERLSLTHAAISDDGRYVAFCGANPTDERQLVFIKSLTNSLRDSVSAHGDPRRRGFKAIEFTGSAVNEITFLPGAAELLVARTSGELLRLDIEKLPGPSPEKPEPPKPPAPWLTLDAPAYQITFSRDGRFAAAACDDGFIRLLDAASAAVIDRINVGETVTSLSLNADGSMLIRRIADGTLALFDLGSGERVATWPASTSPVHPLAAWIDDDRAILTSDDAINEMRPDSLDLLIEQNRVYAAQRRIARALDNYQYEDAWLLAAGLCETEPEIGRNMQTTILREMLRRPRKPIPTGWLDTVRADADLLTSLLLGHAAYEGARFELACECLLEAKRLRGGQTDAYTAWRLAECHYLLGRYDLSAAGLKHVINRRDFNPRDIPRSYLELLTSLTLADRQSEIVEVHQALSASPRLRRLDAYADITAVQVLGRTLLETGAKQPTRRQLQTLFRYLEGLGAPYRDDIEYIAGELAMKRGEYDQAAQRYQRCIDLAQDDWPANWARYRLMQLPRDES